MKTTVNILVLAILAVCINACDSINQDDSELNELLLSCQTTDPINELQWLADLDEKYDSLVYMYQIRIVEFEGNGYILLEDGVSSSPMSTVFDCQEDVAFNTSLSEVHYNDFMKNIETVKVLKSKNWP